MEFGESFEFGLEIIEKLEIDLEGLSLTNQVTFSTDDVEKAAEELADYGYDTIDDLVELLQEKEEELEDAKDDQEWLVQVTVEITMIKAVIDTLG